MKRSEAPFFTPAQIRLIKEDLLKGAPEFEIERFIITCERTGLDCFSRQIYGHLQNKKVRTGKDKFDWVKTIVIITSIDGFRAIAERSGEYRGQTPPEWYYMDHENKSDWHNVFITARDRKGNPLKVPDACRVGVLREGFPAPVYGIANFDSFAKYFKEDANDGGDWVLDTFWKKMPEHMIAKVAEAQAFRKAFPLLACGLFIEEEVKAEEDDEVKPGHEAPAGATFVSPPAAPPKAPAAPPVTPNPPSAPETPAEPAQPATTPEQPGTPAPAKKTAKKPAEKTPEAPAPAAKPVTGGWADYVITQITMAEYQNQRLGDLTTEQIEFLKTRWVDKYAAKIAANPAKAADAEKIKEAFAHHFPG